MDLEAIAAELCRPEVVGHPTDSARVVTTHASVVVLVGDHVYKMKRSVDLGFLDYSTLARRKQMCDAEVELNRRLAPEVYLGVIAICRAGDAIVLGGGGEVVEYAVHMRRLPDTATLSHQASVGALDLAAIANVGARLAAYHRDAPRGPEVARWATFALVAENCADNISALRTHGGRVAPPAEIERLAAATDAELERQRDLISARAEAGVPCEIHGDLRLEHVYVLPNGQLAIIDCIEFADRFRFADPIADVAFLAMDLQAHGQWRAADVLLDAYFEAGADRAGRALLPLYLAYRSLVRAKVRAMQASDPALDSASRDVGLQTARAHIQLATVVLAAPSDRPCLVLVGGLPGTGKSVLSRTLAERAGFTWLRADAIRKELAGIDATASARTMIRDGIYTPEWNDRTYAECLIRASDILFGGGRVLIDASFKEERRRLAFVAAARNWGVPIRILVCTSPPTVVRERLAQRTHDPSDADWTIYQHVRETWEPPGPMTTPLTDEVDTRGTPLESLALAVSLLHRHGLADREIADNPPD